MDAVLRPAKPILVGEQCVCREHYTKTIATVAVLEPRFVQGDWLTVFVMERPCTGGVA